MPNFPENSPDNDVIARAIAGDIEAFGALYDRYLRQIYAFVYMQVTDQFLAEDLTEIVFLKAFEKLPEFRSQKKMDNFRAWIYRIARNLVIDHYRTRKVVLNLDLEAPVEDRAPALEHQVQTSQEVERVFSALDSLDGLLREVIVLRLVNELSYAETAAALDITQNYVRVLQFRALKKLRAILAQDTDK